MAVRMAALKLLPPHSPKRAAVVADLERRNPNSEPASIRELTHRTATLSQPYEP